MTSSCGIANNIYNNLHKKRIYTQNTFDICNRSDRFDETNSFGCRRETRCEAKLIVFACVTSASVGNRRDYPQAAACRWMLLRPMSAARAMEVDREIHIYRERERVHTYTYNTIYVCSIIHDRDRRLSVRYAETLWR